MTVHATNAAVAVEVSDSERAKLIQMRDRALAGSAQRERELTDCERAIDARERKALPAARQPDAEQEPDGEASN